MHFLEERPLDYPIMFYYDDNNLSFDHVRIKWSKICREFSDAALRETASENLSMSSPVYIACVDELNRRNELMHRKSMRDEVRPFMDRRKRESRRKDAFRNNGLQGKKT